MKSTESARWKLEHCQRPKTYNPAAECPEQTSGLQPAAENDEETNETSSPDGDSQADQAEVPFLGATN